MNILGRKDGKQSDVKCGLKHQVRREPLRFDFGPLPLSPRRWTIVTVLAKPKTSARGWRYREAQRPPPDRPPR
jgi:hypothetical protein